MVKITFKASGTSCQIDKGRTLMEAAIKLGLPIDGNCASSGTCGKCKVKVLEGNSDQLSKEEERLLSPGEIKEGYRLACKFVPDTDVVAEILPQGSSADRKTTLLALPEFWKKETCAIKRYVILPENSIHDQDSEAEKIRRMLGNDKLKFSSTVLSELQRVLKDRRDITIAAVNDEVIAVEPADTTDQCYGIAFDIGTTTVVGILWDLHTGEMIGTKAMTNPQGVYGADVISRITYVQESDEKLMVLHYKIIQCLNDILDEICAANGIKHVNVYRCAVDGNTTMSHIFAGVQPESLALAPYIPIFCGAVTEKAAAAGIHICEQGDVYLMPNIAGHVGSDITAGILATNIMSEERYHLLIDIGTNGEIVLAGKGRAFTCSTAAGPAFEGASISRGMRAAAGAIETVVIQEENVIIGTIDDTDPVGICGSGIIDAVGQMVKAGIVDKGGRIVKPDKLAAAGVSEKIVSRVRKGEKGWEFVLHWDDNGDDISILQRDIREVQLAKAAMRTGAEILMENMGISAEELDEISIAGAFGSYISIDNALNIGLLPSVERTKIKAVGNAAGIGTSMAVMSDRYKLQGERYAEEIVHIELAALGDFQERYVRATMF